MKKLPLQGDVVPSHHILKKGIIFGWTTAGYILIFLYIPILSNDFGTIVFFTNRVAVGDLGAPLRANCMKFRYASFWIGPIVFFIIFFTNRVAMGDLSAPLGANCMKFRSGSIGIGPGPQHLSFWWKKTENRPTNLDIFRYIPRYSGSAAWAEPYSICLLYTSDAADE